MKYLTHKLIACCFFLACISCFSSEKVIWKEDFASSGDITANGWKQIRLLDKDEFKVKDGELKALCAFSPYKGSWFFREIPFIRQGELIFEANINSKRARNYKHLSLQLKLYNLSTSFDGYKDSWARYYNEKWATIGKVENGVWTKFKIKFDAESGIVEYYINDMENPALVDFSITLNPEKGEKTLLYIGNYGLANDTVLNEVRNIRLSETGKSSKPQKITFEKSAMVFRGIAFDSYQLDKIISALKLTKSVNYDLIASVALIPKNNFTLDKNPPVRLMVLPEYIILADMPLGNCMPKYAQEMIINAVNKGSTLLILGGLFTLNKGEFAGTELSRILPVKIASPWDVTEFKSAVAISNSYGEKPVARYMHKLSLSSQAEVLACAGQSPFIVGTRYGKGKIIVCLGMPCGTFANDEMPFWKWPRWPEFIADAINKLK